jgi:hypothetical protein
MAKHRRGADFLCDTGLELFSQHPRAGMLVTKKLTHQIKIMLSHNTSRGGGETRLLRTRKSRHALYNLYKHSTEHAVSCRFTDILHRPNSALWFFCPSNSQIICVLSETQNCPTQCYNESVIYNEFHVPNSNSNQAG